MDRGQFKFDIGDIVSIDGIEEILFQIIGVSKQDYENEGQEPYTVHLYKCMNVDDNEDIEYIHEDDLILIQTKGTYELTQTPDPLKKPKSKKKKVKTKQQKKSHKDEINELLDKMNDYILLHKMFGDARFKTTITNTMKKLSELSENEKR